MSEAVPSIAIAKMRNALLPSVSSRLHCYRNNLKPSLPDNIFDDVSGNNEADQLEGLRACMQMEDLNNHFHCNGFYAESRIFNNDSQLGKAGYTIPSQSQSRIHDYNHPTGSDLYGISSSKDISHQQSLLLSKRPSVSQYEGVRGNARKRPFEVIDSKALFKKMESNQESKMTILEPKWRQDREGLERIPRSKLHGPVRRNQKLSDKITTLQKLVSPFGKTDTASVLQEASLYIKLLQEQIRNLYQMLSFSYNSTVKVPHKQVDLRSKGLCLVPISITQKVTMEDRIHHDSAASRILTSPKLSNAI